MTQDLQQTETWEATTGGTTHVHVKDPRERNGWKITKVTGRGRKRIQLTIEERLFNQDLVPEENRHLDPFRNGLLVRTSPPPEPNDADLGDSHYTDDQLVELLRLESDDVFMATVEAIQSEAVVRRLLDLAASKATNLRYTALQEHVDERYHVGKTSRVVQEIYDNEGRYGHVDA